MEEIWVDIIGYEGLYKISNTGKLMSLSKEWVFGRNSKRSKPDTIMSWAKDNFGYSIASIRKNGKKQMISLHRMLSIHFIPNPENKPCVNHIDGNPNNNNISNLEWCTYGENEKHAYSIGGKKRCYGEDSYSGKKVKITKIKTGEIFTFHTLTQAAKELNLNIATISLNLTGKAKSWNYKFEYA